jgi:hypothetical protein
MYKGQHTLVCAHTRKYCCVSQDRYLLHLIDAGTREAASAVCACACAMSCFCCHLGCTAAVVIMFAFCLHMHACVSLTYPDIPDISLWRVCYLQPAGSSLYQRTKGLRWSERLDIVSPLLSSCEPLLALRRQLAGHLRDVDGMGRCWLQHAKLCRATGELAYACPKIVYQSVIGSYTEHRPFGEPTEGSRGKANRTKTK